MFTVDLRIIRIFTRNVPRANSPHDHSPSNSCANGKSIFEARAKLFAGTRSISKRSEPPYCYWMHSPEDTYHTGTPTLDVNFIPIKVRGSIAGTYYVYVARTKYCIACTG